MACLGSGRLCARGVEKLCQIGQKTQVRRKPSAAFVRIKEIGIQPLSRTLVQHCQVSLFEVLIVACIYYLKLLSMGFLDITVILFHILYDKQSHHFNVIVLDRQISQLITKLQYFLKDRHLNV